MFSLSKIIGLSIVAIKGEFNAKGKRIEPRYILFSDGKTILNLEPQDYYDYHNCSISARHLDIIVAGENGGHADLYVNIMKNPDATTDL